MVPNKDDQFDDGLDQFDDELPADDFADDALEPAEGEESFSEEEWDSYDEAGEGDNAKTPPKKKSNMFNIILIAVAVLGGGAFMMMKMGGGGSAPATQAPVIAQNDGAAGAPAMPVPAALPPASPPPAQTGGFLTSPDNMKALEQDIARTYSETDLVGSDDAAPAAPQEVDQAAPPMPTAVEQMAAAPAAPSVPAAENAPPIRMPNAAEAMLKSAMQDKNQASVPAAPAPAAQAPAPVPDVMAAPVQDFAQNAALVAKLDQLLSRLDQLEGDVRSLKTAQPSGDVSALAESVAALEKKLSEQAAQTAKVAAKISERAAAPKPARQAEDRHEAMQAPAPKPQVLGSGSVAAPQPSRATNTAPQAASAPKWVLKGAQPGQAMVSKPGDSEMRSVVVGDTLPGIGTIRSIGYENGRWSVVGTQGRITQ